MLATDRGHYVKESPYMDSPQPIGYDATISAPHMHALVLEELEAVLRPGSRVLVRNNVIKRFSYEARGGCFCCLL